MLILISGKARAGKDTFAAMLAEELFKKTGQVYVLMAYANELKNRVQKDFDMSYEQLWGTEKESCDGRYIKSSKYKNGCDSSVDIYWTAREVMQAYGEFFRDIDNNFWVKTLFSIIEEKEYKNVIITDVRYPNEVDPALERGGYHVRVDRALESKIHGKQHSSETSLDEDYAVDFRVKNNKTFDHLKNVSVDVVAGILQMENFLKERILEYK